MATFQAKLGSSISVRSWLRNFAWLGLIVAAALAIRVVAALTFWRPGAIGGEGAEYARIAENLRNGLGYVGIATPGTELMFPLLFPLLIALSSMVTGDYEWAGRLIAIIFGAALPLPVYGIASRLFGRTAALTAALIAACHPLFIGLSISVLSEGPYATLLLSAVYLVLRALDERSTTKDWCLVGATFGLAYLVRQEAVVPLLIAVFFALVAIPGTRAVTCKRGMAAVVAFFVLASPQIAILYRATGNLSLQGKSAFLFAIGSRMLAGQDMGQAAWAINEKLERTGVCMLPNATIVRETRIDVKRLIRFVAKALRQNTPILLQYVSEPWFGAPLLPALAFLGFFRQPWRQSTASRHLFVLLVAAAAIVTTFSVLAMCPRYYFVLGPFFSIWAANGLIGVARWTKTTVDLMRFERLRFALLGSVTFAIASLAVVAYVFTAANVRKLARSAPNGDLSVASASSRDTKEVGMWIRRQQDRRVKIMDLETPLTFYADAEFVHFPYSNAETATRFLDAAKVDYVILRRGWTFADYYDDWLTNGIQDPRAKLVYASSGPTPGALRVFKWLRNPEPPSAVSKPHIEGLGSQESQTVGPLHVDPWNGRYFADRHNTHK